MIPPPLWPGCPTLGTILILLLVDNLGGFCPNVCANVVTMGRVPTACPTGRPSINGPRSDYVSY